MTPYAEAHQFIQQGPGTHSAEGLSKLLLSLWNTRCAYGFRECISPLDEERSRLALRVISHFMTVGEDDELRQIGQALASISPQLLERQLSSSSKT